MSKPTSRRSSSRQLGNRSQSDADRTLRDLPSHRQSGLGNATSRFLGLIFAAVLSWVLLNILVSPLYGVSRYPRVPVLLGTAVVVLALPVTSHYLQLSADQLERRPRLRRMCIATIFALFFMVQLKVGLAISVPINWDPQVVLVAASDLAAGSPLREDVGQYFTSYPNNILLAVALGAYFAAASTMGLQDFAVAAIALNAIVMSGAVLVAYLSARRIAGAAAAYLVLALSSVLIMFSPWIAVPYSDTLGMIFPVAVLYLFIVERSVGPSRKKLILWAAIGTVGAIGYAVKPPVVFCVLAAALTPLLTSRVRLRRGGVPRFTTLAALSLAIGIIAGTVAVNYVVNRSGLQPGQSSAQAFPITHFLKMGTQRRSGPYNDYYGAYSEADVADTSALPPDERFWGNAETYRDRVSQMGIQGYLVFLNEKANWILGDGSFFMWGEGTGSRDLPFTAQDRVSLEIQQYFGFHGSRHGALLGIWQSVWLGILALASVPLFSTRNPKLFGAAPTMARLSVLMLLGFLLLFEARSRYLYSYLPYFLILTALSVSAVTARVRIAVNKRGQLPHRAPSAQNFEVSDASHR